MHSVDNAGVDFGDTHTTDTHKQHGYSTMSENRTKQEEGFVHNVTLSNSPHLLNYPLSDTFAMSNTKARHLQALAGRLGALNNNLEETELLFAALSHQQLCQREFAIAHGAL